MWPHLFRIIINRKWAILACLGIIGYLMPYFVLGEDTHIRVHDNLDSNIVWYHLLAQSGQIFAAPGTTLPNVINGLPRSALSSSLDTMTWLYVIFKPFTAYVINQAIMRFAAFFGMYGLLRFLFRSKENRGFHEWIAAGVGLGFALLPFWPSGALSIAGLPAALLAFLNIRRDGKHANKIYWGLLFLLPFDSSLILTFGFFIGLVGLLWLYDWWKQKQVNLPLFYALIMMSCIYLLKDYLLIASMFFGEGFTSHRAEFNLGHNSFSETIRLFNKNFIFGHTHDLSIHQKVILPTVIAALLVAFYKKVSFKGIAVPLTMNVLLSFWYALWYWEGWRGLKNHFALLNTFNFSRIHFLHPFLWYAAFAFALVMIGKHVKFGKWMILILMVLQLNMLFKLDEEFKYREIGTPTFKEFYSTDLFREIKDYIHEPPEDYRVVSVALHPVIAQYNGMYTLDTYNVTYPLAYKHKFRKIIAPELAKDPELRNYFDTWGGRLYMYSSELGKHYMFTKNSHKTLEHLTINTQQLHRLGGDYILSGLPIKDYRSLNLAFEKSFENNQSPWKIYLYKVKDD